MWWYLCKTKSIHIFDGIAKTFIVKPCHLNTSNSSVLLTNALYFINWNVFLNNNCSMWSFKFYKFLITLNIENKRLPHHKNFYLISVPYTHSLHIRFIVHFNQSQLNLFTEYIKCYSTSVDNKSYASVYTT